MKTLLLLILLSLPAFAQAQEGTSLSEIQKAVNDTLASKWYERIQLRGYAQFRYNRVLETNEKYACSTCDTSVGKNQGFFMRRARLTFFGDVSDRVFIYIQPDYAQTATNGVTAGTATQNQNFLQIRDAYFDYALEGSKEFRIRTGISKVPFGYDNLQSSGNRAALDRTDAVNNAAPNERDLGVYFMYAPTHIRKIFKELTSNNLKGTGDYGMFAIGVYNGQTLNRGEQNEDMHRVARLTYPWKTEGGQYYEASVAAYEGKFDTDLSANQNNTYDQRSVASFVMYPQPFGFIAEYNVGQGPEFSVGKGTQTKKNLKGGYAQVNYQLQKDNHRFFPYVRYQEYDGGRKLDNAARVFTSEVEAGTEWQPNQALELTIAYAKGTRLRQATLNDKQNESGSLVRLQAQINY